MIKPNALMAFVANTPIQEPIDETTAKTITTGDHVKRGPGRPKSTSKSEVQTTTIRLDPDDHAAVRMLALRDKTKMNDLVFIALRDYCGRRGVQLHGK